MTETPKDSLVPISVAEADALARKLTDGRVGVIQSYGKTYLEHVGKRGMVHLLSYQLTVRGITAAVRENDPWPER
jgi:hypothetical protein